MSSVCLFLLALLVIACLLWRNARRIAKVHLLSFKKGLPRKNETSDTTACRIYIVFSLCFLFPATVNLYLLCLVFRFKEFYVVFYISSFMGNPVLPFFTFFIRQHQFPCVNWFSTSCLRPPPCPLLFSFLLVFPCDQ